MGDQGDRKTVRAFQCRDYLFEIYDRMSDELECSVDYLINEAMREYARAREHTVAAIDAREALGSLIREAELVIADVIHVALFDPLGFDTLTGVLDSIRAAQVFHEEHAVVQDDRCVPPRDVAIANR